MKVMYEAKDTKAVIVGSNSGIAQALIQQLLKSGATIFGVDIQDPDAAPPSR